jgi:hypothetical protein
MSGLDEQTQVAAAPGVAVADAGIRLRVAKSLLRFNTCGSVDDGKSTLIGRLLYDSKALFDDQLATLEADSKKVGTRPGEIDYALCSTACRPSASRASPSTCPTASSPPRSATSSSRTRPGTSSTRATWSRARRPPISASS